MSGLHFCTFVLIAVSCYAFSSSKPVRNEPQQQQAAKKLALSQHLNSEVAAYGRTAAQHTHNNNNNMEARQKRAMGEYKELNDIIDELEENSIAQKVAGIQQPANGLSTTTQDIDMETMPPLTYYLLLQKLRQLQSGAEPTYRVRTPRLGRSIDFQQWLDAKTGASTDGHHGNYVAAIGSDDDDDLGSSSTFGNGVGTSRQFMPHMMKKSVPFKPRLGKRAQVCGD